MENAIQFRGRSNPIIRIEAKEELNGVQITFQDNGQGVEDEYKNRVFEMFFRGNDNSKGNGLGLYIVEKAIEKLQGKIHFESTFGVGTLVTVWLPFELTKVEDPPTHLL